MRFDRSKWDSLYVGADLDWPCPHCGKRTLSFPKKEKAQSRPGYLEVESTRSKQARRARPDIWEQDWETGDFTAQLVCDRCTASVLLVGEYSTVELESDYTPEFGQTFISTSVLKPRCVHPARDMFEFPEECPKEIVERVRGAFSLFWLDAGACCNRIRSAIEAILSDQGVRRFAVIKKKKIRRSIDLHNRIGLYRSSQGAKAEVADHMIAVKWIGNSGSHDGENLEASDALDGFERLAHILWKLYDDSEAELLSGTKAINKRKKARSHARAKRK